VFVFNFNASTSFSDYLLDAPPGRYKMILNTDSSIFGGSNRLIPDQVHFTIHEPKAHGNRDLLSLYLPTRTAVVLKHCKKKSLRRKVLSQPASFDHIPYHIRNCYYA
ncbi:MAG: hypothetical protein DSY98_00690, partial [SAR324 cluster bacterium]